VKLNTGRETVYCSWYLNTLPWCNGIIW